MDKAFEPLVKALEDAAGSILNISPQEKRTFNEIHGWNQVGLNLEDLAGFSSRLASDIRKFGIEDVSEEDASYLATVAAQFEHFRANTLGQLWGGNGPFAVTAYVITIDGIRVRIQRLIPEFTQINPRALPSQLAKKITRISAELDAVVVDKDTLNERMQMINEAHATAESLPEDLFSLQEARRKVEKLSSESSVDGAEIKKKLGDAAYRVGLIEDLSGQAEKLVAQCEEAYRVTTTKGLAGAFEQRATGLNTSIQLWVIALVVSLCVAAFLGGQRVELLSKNLGEVDPKWGVIWLNFALSILSVGAPLWFAWVATKQVGQRFRLAEDYGYKASVAKAYEGYRREAAKLDPEFAARLFGSSLTRLEEAPLRLMEATSHGSPLHELLNSKKAQEAIATVPALREKMIDLATELQRAVGVKSDKAKDSVEGG